MTEIILLYTKMIMKGLSTLFSSNPNITKQKNMTTIGKVEQWVIDRNLHTQDPKVQMCKTMEELGELAKAINKGDKEKQMDGIGDTVVTLICIAEQLGLNLIIVLIMLITRLKTVKENLLTVHL